jgi:hypothetical protein
MSVSAFEENHTLFLKYNKNSAFFYEQITGVVFDFGYIIYIFSRLTYSYHNIRPYPSFSIAL